MKKKIVTVLAWLTLILCGLCFVGSINYAFAQETSHNITIAWYYGSEPGDLINGEAGAKLGEIIIPDVPNGEFDFTDYVNNPEGATLYRMYGVLPIIRINGKYYLLSSKYFEGNSYYDDWQNIVILDDSDTDVALKLYYDQVQTTSTKKLDKIKISVDDSVVDNLTELNHYSAYKIFDVTKSSDVVEDVTTDETVGQTLTGEETGFSYYIMTSSEWYPVIAEMTEYFQLIPTVEEDVYIVRLAEGVEANESTAKEIAKELEKYTNGKTAIDITANNAKMDADPGYYLIVSPISSNFILATTNIDITEKISYPTVEKTVTEEDKNAAMGQDVHFESTVFVPRGSRKELTITDTMTEGLTFKPESLSIDQNINYTMTPTNDGFVITIPDNQIAQLVEQDNITLKITYCAELNKKAIIAPRDDTTMEGNVNTIKIEYGNYVQESSVDVDTTQFVLLKYSSDDENKTPLGGATFNLYDENGEIVKLYEIKPNEEYRLATSTDTSYMTELKTVNNKTIKIIGVDADINYNLKETIAPRGYNLLAEEVSFQPEQNNSSVIEIANSTGIVLPSTGGIGTQIFYIIGATLALSSLLFFSVKLFIW